MAPKKKSKGGRPAAIPTPEQCNLAYNLCLMMATNEKIAELCGVSLRTVQKWMVEQPEFKHAIRKGRDRADSKQVRAMFDKGIGYDYVERTYEHTPMVDKDGVVMVDENGDARTIRTLVKEIHKHQPPDVPAAKFFLWNRTKTKAPEEQWNDKQQLDLSNDDGSLAKTDRMDEAQGVRELMSVYLNFIKDSQKVS